MDHKAQFLKILKRENEGDAILFLRGMDEKQRDAFAPLLLEICKEYLEFRRGLKGTSYTFTRLATDRQASVLNLAALACFNERDFRKWVSLWQMKVELLSGILDWYRPKWFNKYINSFAEEDFIPLFIRYDWIMELAERQFIIPSKELIVKILPQALFEQTADRKTIVRPDKLLRRAITLDEHIWYFFEIENTVYMSDRYLYFADKGKVKESEWIICFRDLCEQGKLDRHRLLEESILATARNFNKPLAGWYCDLFSSLRPAVDEIANIQRSLMNALNAKHSRAVNTSLNALRQIAEEKYFDVNGFLESIPLLLSSETKTVINAALAILDKIAKKHQDRRESVCVAAIQAFVHNDDDIQSRAAKVINKYGDQNSRALKESLLAYRGSFLVNTITALSAFLDDQEMHKAVSFIPDTSDATGETRSQRAEIPEVRSFDKLIFLSSQAFDNNQSYHIDTLPAAMLALQKELRGENIAKLEPALQRAFKVLTNGLTSTTGGLDHLLATFFVEFTAWLIGRHPSESGPLETLHEAFARDEKTFRERMRRYYSKRLVPLRDWKTLNDDTAYDPHKRILLLALEKLRSEDALPLLSTPTHEPTFISPAALIHRLQRHQETDVPVNAVDLQIAISRCDLAYAEDYLATAEQSLKGEYRNLVKFLLTPGSRPEGPFALSAAWLAAAVARDGSVGEELSTLVSQDSVNYLTGQFKWQVLPGGAMIDRYNYVKQKFDKFKTDEKTRSILFKGEEPKGFSLKSIFSSLRPDRESTSTIYDLLKLRLSPFGSSVSNDIARILYLTPNNPEPMLAQVISRALIYNRFPDADGQKLVANTIEALMPVDATLGQMGHLFIAACMLSADKTIQSFAAELWSKGVVRKRVDSKMLGQIIGVHESIEFAPMRRLTDLISSGMSNISTVHNNELETLLSEVILKLPREPVTGLKKLLEIYFQVVSLNRAQVNDKVSEHISMWREVASLKKVLASAAV